MFSSLTSPSRFKTSRAPSTKRSQIRLLKRDTTMANFPSLHGLLPSITLIDIGSPIVYIKPFLSKVELKFDFLLSSLPSSNLSKYLAKTSTSILTSRPSSKSSKLT